MNLEDIAKKAGVSRSTVSRVINDDPKVAPETRERVLKIIQRERFSPNPAARALVTRRTEIIGVIIPSYENIFFTDNSYFPMMLAGFNDATRTADYAMLLWLGEVAADDARLMAKISGNKLVDGLVLASFPIDHAFFPHLFELNTPFVMVDKPLRSSERINYVTVDNFAAAEMAVNHLVKLGRRRIAHITGNLNISDGVDRLEGYKQALVNAGLPVDPHLIQECYFNKKMGYEAMKRLLPYKPDALFAAGDTIAVGALEAIQEAGLRCPEDISIIGFDDIDVALASNPKLTTVRQPIQTKGATAVRLLIDLLQQRLQPPQHILLPTELIVRESCGAS
jgi:LacI family transcriptional regulator